MATGGRVPFWRNLTLRGLLALVAMLALLSAAIAYQVRAARASREAAMRSQCSFNLRVIGIAALDFANARGYYPPGSIPNDAIAPDRRLGWMVEVYSHGDDTCIECPSIDVRKPSDDPGVEVVARNWLDPMNCPACLKARGPRPTYPASFIGIAGLGVDAPSLPKTDKRAGIFGDDRQVTPADVTDGLANTMMVAESFTAGAPWHAGGRATVRGLDPATRPYIGRGRPFGGIHGEGANVLMADGSVRWVRPTPSSRGFEAMSTIAGSEVVSDPDDSL